MACVEVPLSIAPEIRSSSTLVAETCEVAWPLAPVTSLKRQPLVSGVFITNRTIKMASVEDVRKPDKLAESGESHLALATMAEDAHHLERRNAIVEIPREERPARHSSKYVHDPEYDAIVADAKLQAVRDHRASVERTAAHDQRQTYFSEERLRFNGGGYKTKWGHRDLFPGDIVRAFMTVPHVDCSVPGPVWRNLEVHYKERYFVIMRVKSFGIVGLWTFTHRGQGTRKKPEHRKRVAKYLVVQGSHGIPAQDPYLDVVGWAPQTNCVVYPDEANSLEWSVPLILVGKLEARSCERLQRVFVEHTCRD